MRNYQHYLAISQGGPIELDTPSHPDDEALNQLLPEYCNIVLDYVRAVRIREDRPSARVRAFAHKLFTIRARARDVVHLHLEVLNKFSQRALPSEDRVFSNDARLVLVEIMGNILDSYM